MFVYFIQCGESGPIKIGLSKYVEKRLRGLQTSSPYDLRLLAVEPGSVTKEIALHHRFAHLRIRGEWFHPTAELIARIGSEDTHTGAVVITAKAALRVVATSTGTLKYQPRCSICTSPHREDVHAHLLAGTMTQTELARRHGFTQKAMSSHKRKHMGLDVRLPASLPSCSVTSQAID